MRFGALGPRATKLFLRNAIIALVAGFVWLESQEILCDFGLAQYSFWLSLPFWLIGLMAILGVMSIGPLGKGFREAVREDKKEEWESKRVKKPWE
jgi:hypothetical protein